MNEPAFPVNTSGTDGHQSSSNTWQFPGMSLRDWMAAHAPTAELANLQPSQPWNDKRPESIFQLRYRWADKMLEARKEGV